MNTISKAKHKLPILLFDIGGTKLRAGFSSDGKRIDRMLSTRTPVRFADGIRECNELAKRLLNSTRPGTCVVGIAGILNRTKSQLFRNRNLRAWEKKPLQAELRRLFQVPVRIENDADLGALGEATFGAGRGHRIVAFLTVGTGFGGARIVDGRIDAAALGFEPGKQIVTYDEKGTRRPEEVEPLVAGVGVAKKYGKAPRLIRDRRVWSKLSDLFAVAVVNTIVFWSPDIVVLGGSMLKAPGLSVSRVRRRTREWLTVYPKLPRIVRGQLGDRVGLYGALALARQRRRAS